jgi:hypothetical protein
LPAFHAGPTEQGATRYGLDTTATMQLESTIRDFADRTGRVWLAYQAIAMNGTQRIVPWVTFVQLATGERVSGRIARSVAEMDESDLASLLETLRAAPAI